MQMEVALLDTFGDDLTVVNAARVSFAKESAELCLQDEKLISRMVPSSDWICTQ